MIQEVGARIIDGLKVDPEEVKQKKRKPQMKPNKQQMLQKESGLLVWNRKNKTER